MKDYTVKGDKKELYITKMTRGKKGTLDVKFADGRVFKNIDACEENIEKIVVTQEEQAKRGIKNFAHFVREKKNAVAETIGSGVVAGSVATGVTFIPKIHEALSVQDPIYVVAGIGAITVLSMVPGLVKLVRSKGKVKELEKLSYRESNLDNLNNFRNYPNALVGVRPEVASRLERSKNPFSILNIDSYSLEDLQQIMKNINVEEAYDFTYGKEGTKAK